MFNNHYFNKFRYLRILGLDFYEVFRVPFTTYVNGVGDNRNGVKSNSDGIL